ncbi:MAG: hypothetical protein ACR2QO_22915 [Acidimicrobiales bacterium]
MEMGMTMLMNEARPEWLPTLGSGEQLLWRGQASRRLLALRMSDLVHVPMGIVSLLVGMNVNRFVGVGSIGPDPSPRPSMFTLVATMFVAFGLFELFGRHVVNFVRRHRTSYALTTNRVFIRTGVFRQVTRQRNLTPGDPPEFTIGSNGTGTIVFAPPEPRRRFTTSNRGGRDLVEAVSAGLDGFQFYGVPDADRVRAFLVSD